MNIPIRLKKPCTWIDRSLGKLVETNGLQQVRAFEACLGRKPDAIFAHRLASMCPPLLTHEPLPPIFFDIDDVEHVAFWRNISQETSWRSKLVGYVHIPALWWGERRAIQLAHRTFVCSELDRHYLAERWHLPGVVTIPNAVSATKSLPMTADPTLLFIGSYGYRPNVQAAEFLIGEIWPHVYRAVPQARLIIAGAMPENIPSYQTDVPGVEFTGFVADLDELYQRSRVVCCPILAGSGTRIKIIEAAAYGKPIIATRLGAEGLAMHDGSELLLRDDPESFAEACLTLLKDPDLCERLGSAARETAIRCYDRANIVRLIQKYFTDGKGSRGLPEHRQASGTQVAT